MDIAVSPHSTQLRPHLPTQETDRFKYTEFPPPRPPYLSPDLPLEYPVFNTLVLISVQF